MRRKSSRTRGVPSSTSPPSAIAERRGAHADTVVGRHGAVYLFGVTHEDAGGANPYTFDGTVLPSATLLHVSANLDPNTLYSYYVVTQGPDDTSAPSMIASATTFPLRAWPRERRVAPGARASPRLPAWPESSR